MKILDSARVRLTTAAEMRARRASRGWVVIFMAALMSGCVSFPDIYSTDVQTLRAAIANGEDPNQVDRNFTPLWRITWLGVKTMTLKPIPPDDRRYIPESRRVEVARLLLDAGADPNRLSRDNYGQVSPLMTASANCLVDTVRLLLERGADPMLRLPVYGNALLSVTGNCAKVVESEAIAGMILDHVERKHGRATMLEYANARGDGRLTPLALATWFDRRGAVAAMLARGVDLDVGGPRPGPGGGAGDGWTPLHIAVGMERDEILTALVLAGARTDLVNDQGVTAMAVNERYWQKVSLSGALAAGARGAMRQQSGPMGVMANAREQVEIRSGVVTRDLPNLAIWRSEPPPPGWNGLEDALKKRAALMAKSSAKPETGKKPVSR